MHNKQKEYAVKWLGFPDGFNSFIYLLVIEKEYTLENLNVWNAGLASHF